MKEVALSLLTIAVIQVSGQGFLWDRIEDLDADGFLTPGPALSQPKNCVKKWGTCRKWGNTNRWYSQEQVVTPASNGGFCELDYRICTPPTEPPTPVNCVKKWGNCIQASSTLRYRKEVIVTPAKNGGKCEIKYDFEGCKPKPKKVDCVKVWTSCEGKGPRSFTRQRVVTKPRNGGKSCGVLGIKYGCNPNPVDCVREWTECTGVGKDSYKLERIVTPAQHGGKSCGKLNRITNCNPRTKDSNFDEDDDSKGKATATLFMRNFIPPAKASSSGTGTSSSGTAPAVGERSLTLSLDLAPQVLPAKAKPDDNVEKDDSGCPVAKFKNTTFGVGCDLDSLLTNKTAVAEWDEAFKTDPRARGRSRRSTPANNDIFSQIPDQRDVLFLLDSSGSVGPYHFRTLKKISTAIVDILCGPIKLHRDRTRISMATFNARQLLKFPFTTTASVVEVKSKINAVGFDYRYSYQSCIKDALNFIVEKVYTRANGARDPWVAEGDVIIMTDGCANCDYSYQNRELQRAAYRLKLNKINVYAIGIGIDENCRNILKVLARGGRCFHFFYLDNWDVDAEDFLYRLQNPPKNRCLDRWEFPGINCVAVS